ncbi:hypothetical protein [Aureibaculum luteum]|uniref:hypothetical protein n=1 Tax=Aureibaculum luteum TaxID=1548456 RepID=UPI000E46EBBB|nr:hypothetical protein [Aureibaculum luteum]
MPIKMQGAWFVRVKSKSASFAQRFIISGANQGNGTYNGVVSDNEYFVSGNSWNIAIQNKPSSSSSYVNSTMKLKFPQIVGGEYRFNLESNDSGGDADFNDLILSFRTPATPEDYVVYGNISYYKGCLINPCWRLIVIDTYPKLKEVLINPQIREAVKSYYPQLVDSVMFNPQPDPPRTFKPIVVPFGGPAIPEKEEITVISKPEEISIKANKKENREAVSYTYNALKSTQSIRLETSNINTGAAIDKNKFIDAARIVDRFRRRCETGPIPYALLNFEEYDRTTAELSGGAYTGTGERENLGTINADHFGNYILRFNRTDPQNFNESEIDTASGENAFVQARPDLTIKLLDPLATSSSLFETAPYWNVPYLKRINLCIPIERSGLIPVACQGQHILQGIGNIALGKEESGVRGDFNNTLNNLGIITANADIAPKVQCAAWSGQLILRGCLKNVGIKYYTIEYRKGLDSWQYLTKDLRLPYLTTGFNALVNRTFSTPSSLLHGYLNIETDSGLWLEGYKNIKAKILTNEFDNGTYYFRIQGYKDDGSKFANSEDTIRLYLQKTRNVTAVIDLNVTMGGNTIGECGLFTLPVDSSNNIINDAPMTIRFKVDHNPGEAKGFMNSYELTMGKGATEVFPLNVPLRAADFSINDPNRGRYYVENNPLNCNISFKGTGNETMADAEDYYTVIVQPASGGWLTAEQNFCAFKIRLVGNLRLTNGNSGYQPFNAIDILIGIEKPEPA